MSRIALFMIRRAVAGLFMVWAIFTITFFIFWAIPSEPAHFVYPFLPHPTNDQIRHAHHLLGIDRPLLTLYGDALWKLLHGVFGRDWSTYAQYPGSPTLQPGLKINYGDVRDNVVAALPATLSIILGGAVLVLVLAVPLGTIAGSRLRSLSDRTISLVALIGVCTHPMVIGLILRGIFGDHLHWASVGYCPITGTAPPPLVRGAGNLPVQAGLSCNGISDWAAHMALPWITFALLFLALYTRMVRASVAETMPEDFVRTARAKGASEFRILSRHVLPNASLRILTMIGMEIGTAIGVCIYIESAFGVGGLASGSISALVNLNLPEILGYVTVITLIVVVGNLVVDALYAVVDPRIRFNIERTRTKSLAGGVL
jgi:peptide/nickel transport system permease protein